MASHNAAAITFAVPGQSGPLPPPAATRSAGAVAQPPLPGTVKASVRVATQRDGAPPVQVTAVPGEDIVALHIENGPVLLLHPATARDLLQGPAAAQRDADAKDDSGDTVAVQAALHWPGADAGSADPDAAAMRGLADLGRVVVSGFQVLTGLLKDPAADFAASLVVQHVDGQVDAGVYALQPERLDKLKHSGSKVARIAPSQTPLLVLVHGTFVETTSTFDKLWQAHRASVDKLFAQYQGQVYALDHPTLGASPIANARTLVDTLPDGARLHLVTHSRGGLVAEVLARLAGQGGVTAADLAFFDDPADAAQQQELRELGEAVRTKRMQVERVVRVACPARGTLLASKRLDAYLSVLKWTLEASGLPVVPAFVDFIGEVARRRADPAQIPGLAAMIPGTALVNWLNAAPQAIPGDLRVVAGDLQHGSTLGSWLKALLADAYYWTDNDIVVHTRSMYGGAPRAGGATYLLDQGPNTTHFSYFVNDSTANAIVAALLEAEPPAGFKTIGPLSWAGSDASGVRGGPQQATRGAIGLPLGQQGATPADASKPAVFILPGILGSNLKVADAQGQAMRIWLSPRLAGNFSLLAYQADAPGLVTDDGPVGLVYDKLVDFLSATHEVIPFGYDWRQPLQDEARRLAARVRQALDARRASGQPVRLLAHSMGGLLARALQLVEPATWQRLLAHADARLLMLGTPNAGSWAPMQVLSGDDTFGNALAAIGAPLANHQARVLMAQMPGFLQLQAGLLDPALGLDREATWQQLADDDYQAELQRNWWQRYAGDVQTAAYKWGVPPQAVLDQARALRIQLDAQVAGALTTDAAKLRLVVGQARFTPDGYQLGNDGFVYLDAQDGGDGRVPLASALLPGVATWTLDCAHGALPGASNAFDAYLDLLQHGSTTRLQPLPLPLPGAPTAGLRGGGGPGGRWGAQAPPHVASRPSRQPPSAEPPGNIDQVFGGSPAPAGTPADAAVLPALQVEVLNGNLTFVAQPLLLGHYSALQLTGTEAVVDSHLGGSMHTALQAGIYPEAPGTHRVFFNNRRDDANPWQLPRPQAAIVVGLGAEGTLTSAGLEFSVCQGVKAWAQRAAEDAASRSASRADLAEPADGVSLSDMPAHAAGPDAADAASTAPGIALAATLIGSGGIGMSAGEAARAIARGVRLANERLHGSSWPLVTRLTLVEWYLDRAGDAWRGVHLLRLSEPGAYVLAPTIASGTGPLRRQPDSGYRGANYDIIDCSTLDDGSIAFALDTRRARTEVRAQHTQSALVRKLVERAANAAHSDPQLGSTLFKLLVPPGLTPFLSGNERMLLQLDAGTAPIPWELLDTQPAHSGGGGNSGGDSVQPWAIRTQLLRKLATSTFNPAPRDATADDAVLVIGAPLVDPLLYPDLPAARAEAVAVAAAFSGPGGIGASRVVALLDGAPFDAVIGALMARPYRIVHVAGHGMPAQPDPSDGNKLLSRGGVVLSEGIFLGPDEIAKLSPVPQLVFVNCCHLGGHDSAGTLLARPPAFAAAVADALIDIGVRCVVAAGWAVDDLPAALFAQAFYRQLLAGRPFVDAVTAARTAARDAAPNSKTWAAYQCYGDPDWVFQAGVRDAQTASPVRDALESIVSPPGLALVLETLAVRAQFAVGRQPGDTARQHLAAQARLADLAQRHGDSWGGIGAVAEAFAVAWQATGDDDNAIAWYQRALQASDASASLKAQEQLGSLLVQRAWRLAKAAAPGSALLRRARQDIDAALPMLTALATLHPTVQRHGLRGAAWQRLAQVLEAGNGGQPGSASNKALRNALAACRLAEQQAVATHAPDLFHPASQRMALELALHAGNAGWAGFDPAAQAGLLRHLQARCATQPDFCSNVALIDLALYGALAGGQLAPQLPALTDAYTALHAQVQIRSAWDAVADRLQFVLAPPRGPSAPADQAAAARLLQLVDGFAQPLTSRLAGGPAGGPAGEQAGDRAPKA